jgi:hypothetical protein
MKTKKLEKLIVKKAKKTNDADIIKAMLKSKRLVIVQ